MFSIRTILMATLLLAGASSTASAQWFTVDTPTSQSIRDIGMHGTFEATAVGDGGLVIQSFDGGVTWHTAYIANDPKLQGVGLRAIDAHPLGGMMAVGERGRVVRSDDGVFFAVDITDTTWSLRDVARWSDTLAIAVGHVNGQPLIIRSSDKGASWTRVSAPGEDYGFTAVRCISERIVVAAASLRGTGSVGDPAILRSTDGGRTWSPVFLLTNMEPTSFVQFGNEVICVGRTPRGEGKVIRSLDAGATWRLELLSEADNMASAVLVSGTEVHAVGRRFVQHDTAEDEVLTHFVSTDRGRSWSITDVADGRRNDMVIATSGDRALIGSDHGSMWLRWVRPSDQAGSSIFRRKHVEFGAVHGAVDTVVTDIVHNDEAETLYVESVRVLDPHGVVQLRTSYDDLTIMPGTSLDVALRFAPRQAREHWALLHVRMRDGREHVVHLSGSIAHRDPQSPLAMETRVVDLGDVVDPRGMWHATGDLFRNLGDTNVTVTDIHIEDGDNHAFEVDDVEMPVAVGPDGTFSWMVRFAPIPRGIYRTTLVVTVADTQLRIPIVGTCRIDEHRDVIDFGIVGLDSMVERPVYFSARVWGEDFGAMVLDHPAVPFVLVGGDETPAGDWRIDVQARAFEPGIHMVSSVGRWSGRNGTTQWRERFVLRMHVPEPTSAVDDVDARQHRIVPNPATDRLRILAEHGFDRAEIIDVHGRCLQRIAHDTSAAVDVSGLIPGLYVIVIHDGRTATRRTFIKQ